MPELVLTKFENVDPFLVELEDLSGAIDALLGWLFTPPSFPDGLRKNPYYYGSIKLGTRTTHRYMNYVYKRVLKSDYASYMNEEIAIPVGLNTDMVTLFKTLENKLEDIHRVPGLLKDGEILIQRLYQRPDKFDLDGMFNELSRQIDDVIESLKELGNLFTGKKKTDLSTISMLYGNKKAIYDAIAINNRLEKQEPVKFLSTVESEFKELSTVVATLLKSDTEDTEMLMKVKKLLEKYINLGEVSGFYMEVLLGAISTLVLTVTKLYDII